MRRLALLVTAAAALSGCHYAASPFDGFGSFISDTHTFARNPNLPPGASETIARAEGQPVTALPLLPESGNIWPGPPKAQPTLEDMIREEQSGTNGLLPPEAPEVAPGSAAHPQPRPANPPGSSTPPPAQPQSPSVEAPPAPPPAASAAPIRVPAPTVATPNGVAVLHHGGNGITTTTSPAGTSIIVPNGNGTSTIIGPDGSTQTIPTPK